MATILNFVRRRPETGRRTPPGTTASIVFFPGVRYERGDEVRLGFEKSARGQPRRKSVQTPL